MPSFNDLPPELMEMVLTESLQPHLDVCNQPITGSNKEEVYEALRSLAACIPPLISTSRAVAPNVIYVIRKNILPAIKTMINWLDNNVPPSHERDFDDDRGFPVFAIHVHGKFQGHTEGLRTGVLCCMKGLEEKYKIAATNHVDYEKHRIDEHRTARAEFQEESRRILEQARQRWASKPRFQMGHRPPP